MVLVAGITPACAGKTEDFVGNYDRSEDHPRVCGENRFVSVAAAPFIGSPPRVRGKRLREALKLTAAGITPACAGKTFVCVMALWYREDHPRVCGENRG